MSKITLGKKVNKMEKTVNYTEAQVERIHEAAEEAGGKFGNSVAEQLAIEFGKDVRSVRAKASREGVYQAKAKTTKSGQPIERKEAIVADIAALVGQAVDGLEKAPKEALQRVRSALSA